MKPLLLEGIPRLDILNERVAFCAQTRDWALLARTLVAIERTQWELPLRPVVETMLIRLPPKGARDCPNRVRRTLAAPFRMRCRADSGMR